MTKNSGQFKKGQHWREVQLFRERAWLVENYVVKERSAGDIAQEFSVTDAAILFWLRRHKIPRRTVSQARSIKHWGAVGVDNPMWNRKGELNPRWKGGVTKARQLFYVGQEWKKACREVWKRDDAKCQRCGLDHRVDPGVPIHVHHLESFAVVELRADTTNLILLCEPCHLFVHSKKNTHREYLP